MENENSPLRTLLITCVVLAALALGGYWYANRAPSSPSPAATTTEQYGVSGLPEGATITEVPVAQAPQAPNYRAPVVYGAEVTADVKAAVEPKVAADVA